MKYVCGMSMISFGSDSFQCINFRLVQTAAPVAQILATARKHIPLWANIRYIVYDEVRHFLFRTL